MAFGIIYFVQFYGYSDRIGMDFVMPQQGHRISCIYVVHFFVCHTGRTDDSVRNLSCTVKKDCDIISNFLARGRAELGRIRSKHPRFSSD